MKTAIPAAGYALVLVDSGFDHDVIPVLAFVIDADAAAFDVVTPTGDQIEQPGNHFAPGLQVPDGRVYCCGSEFANAEAFARSCRRMAEMNAASCSDLV